MILGRGLFNEGISLSTNSAVIGLTSLLFNKTIMVKISKQDLTSAKDLTIELPEEREFPYHRLD